MIPRLRVAVFALGAALAASVAGPVLAQPAPSCQGLPGRAAEARCLAPLANQGQNEAQGRLQAMSTAPGALAWLSAADAAHPGSYVETLIADLYGPPPADGGVAHDADYATAMSWLRRAASHCDNGADEAQLQIGDLYAYGAGVPRDPGQALTWYLIASRMQTTASPAGELADDMRSRLSRAQIRAATTRARNYLTAHRCAR